MIPIAFRDHSGKSSPCTVSPKPQLHWPLRPSSNCQVIPFTSQGHPSPKYPHASFFHSSVLNATTQKSSLTTLFKKAFCHYTPWPYPALFSFMVLITTQHVPCCHGVFIPICQDRLECGILQWRNLTIFFSELHPHYLEECLAQSWHSTKICRINVYSFYKDLLWYLPNKPPNNFIFILQMTKLAKSHSVHSRHSIN